MSADRTGKKTRPVTPEERASIVASIRAGKARNEVARESGRSPGTITTIARDEGLSFERAGEVAAATEARQADNRARRAALIGALYEDADWMRQKLRERHTVHDFTKDGEFVTGEIDLPTAGDMRAYMTAVGIALDKALLLERADGGADGQARGLLERLIDGIEGAA